MSTVIKWSNKSKYDIHNMGKLLPNFGEEVALGRLTLKGVKFVVECVWNLMAHRDARVGKWRGNWRMAEVASTLTLPRNVVSPALLPLMRTPRLPVVDWTDAPANLNWLVRFSERRNLVSARVPSHFKSTLQQHDKLGLKSPGTWHYVSG